MLCSIPFLSQKKKLKNKKKIFLNTSFQKFNSSMRSEIGNDHYQTPYSELSLQLEHALLSLPPSLSLSIGEYSPPFF